MIALLTGEVAVRRTDHVVVSCAGVGYRLSVSSETLRHTPAVGKPATLHTHLIVRDDALQLYGFSSEAERDLFLMLIGVQSVNPTRWRSPCSRAGRRASCSPPSPRATPRGCRRCPGSASGRRSGSWSSCARRSARRRPTTRSWSRAATTRGCSPGTASSASASPPPRPSSCSTGRPASTPEDLIAHALKGARR